MIKTYLEQKGLIEKVLTIKELEKLAQTKTEINLMMGQTFDEGQPLDMLKYALFIMNLSDLMRQTEVKVNSTWLIADHFISEINNDKDKDLVKMQARDRITYLRLLNVAYRGNIGFMLSSELSKSENYQKILAQLKNESKNNTQFRQALLNAVPEDRRANEKATEYSLEELATIQAMNAHVKVGPKYELFYDEPAREMSTTLGANKFVAIHLTNCWPLGTPSVDDKTKKEIESFGVLPYKKNSKRLGAHRIDPLNDSSETVKKLIQETKSKQALLNLLVTLELAQQRIEGKIAPGFFGTKTPGLIYFDESKEEVSSGNNYFNPQIAQDLAIGMYQKYVQKPLSE
ncbi:hypothetical protein HZA97_09035 [Candidatus Woesearchaeota archaeon]|nr:hypothetical protein [Candidatus Woesearchaeota archaeon]